MRLSALDFCPHRSLLASFTRKNIRKRFEEHNNSLELETLTEVLKEVCYWHVNSYHFVIFTLMCPVFFTVP